MTVSTETRKAGPYAGNGVATSFAFAFKVFEDEDLLVTHADDEGAETTLELDVDFSVTLNADQDASPGGTITYPLSGSALSADDTLTIDSDVDETQSVDLVTGGAFLPQVIEHALDRAVILVQQVRRLLTRSMLQPKSDEDAIGELPTAANRAGKFLYFDEDGNPTALAGTGAVENSVPVNDSSANRNLSADDIANYVRMTSGSANTVTISAAVLAALPLWAELNGIQAGAGQTTVTPGVGVTLNGTPGLKTRAQFSPWIIKKVSDTEADVLGDLTA